MSYYYNYCNEDMFDILRNEDQTKKPKLLIFCVCVMLTAFPAFFVALINYIRQTYDK